jgi:L-cystine uptake protein TcyP (sodium:dicarboxylate symporter family)
MARTALNVNGSMVAGVLTGQFLKGIPTDAKNLQTQPATAD